MSKEGKESSSQVEWLKRQRDEDVKVLRTRLEQEVTRQEEGVVAMRNANRKSNA